MRKQFLFELCAETLEAVQTAEACGVARVELCAQLQAGGVTPALSLIRAAVEAVHLPIHVLVRPRPGSFAFAAGEFAQMRREIGAAQEAGAAGVVLGALTPDLRVDTAGIRPLIELARPMKVTFHRAFDAAADLPRALEDAIDAGADYLLTSGGAPHVLAGADRLAQLQRQAAGRITLIAGGGLALPTLAEVVRRTGVTEFHGSLYRRELLAANGRGEAAHYPNDILRRDIAAALGVLDDLETEASVA